MRGLRAIFIFIIAASVLVPARAWAQVPRPGGELVWFVGREPAEIIPYRSVLPSVAQIGAQIYDGLLDYDENLKPVPALAESWSVAADGLSIRFALRKDVTFHDGKPFTSADVEFSIMEMLKAKHPRGKVRFSKVTRVETPDAHTAIVRLSQPAPYILSGLGAHESPMLPKHLFAHGPRATTSQFGAAVGTGPFKLSHWHRGHEIRLDRNPGYWRRGQPRLARILIRFTSDGSEAATALENGTAHAASAEAVTPVLSRRLIETGFVRAAESGSTWRGTLAALVLNTTKPPFDNVKVRRAVALGLEPMPAIKAAWAGFGTPATGPLHSSLVSAGLAAERPPAPPVSEPAEKAAALLDEAGLHPRDDGIRAEIVLDVAPLGADWQLFAQNLELQLARIGIKTRQRIERPEGWLTRIDETRDFDAVAMPVYTLADPVINLHRLLHGPAEGAAIRLANPSGWRNAEADRAMDRATVAVSMMDRLRNYEILRTNANHELPVIWIAEPAPPALVVPRLRGAFRAPLGPYAPLIEAWLAEPSRAARRP